MSSQPAPQASTQRFLRDCLGRFATGVTIIATRDAAGRPVGLTANSFGSLSLDPPLVLWSLGRHAFSAPIFQAASHFGVSVLAGRQVELARRFAQRRDDRFDGVALRASDASVPLIAGAIAWFECRRVGEQLQGDHLIFIGEVEQCGHAGGEPLLFHDGRLALPHDLAERLPRELGDDG